MTTQDIIQTICNKNSSKKPLSGEIYGKLKVIKLSYIEDYVSYYLCECNCFDNIIKEINVSSSKLKSGHTVSCGCAKYGGKREYAPTISSARYAWRRLYKFDGLSFEDFYILSQMNCYLCNLDYSNEYEYNKNQIENKINKSSVFRYNGLDRLDNDKNHSLENVFPCCKYCNFAKNNYTFEEYVEWMKRINKNILNVDYDNIKLFDEKENQILCKKVLTNAKGCWKHYRRAGATFDFEYFLKLSQSNCFYCDIEPKQISNRKTRASHGITDPNNAFIYNGIDKIVPTKGYCKENVVPCCYQCNLSKSYRSFEDFKQWVIDSYKNIQNIEKVGIETIKAEIDKKVADLRGTIDFYYKPQQPHTFNTIAISE